MIFWRILDSKLYSAGETDKLGFEESEGLVIPDEYLEQQEFVIMRTCHGIFHQKCYLNNHLCKDYS